MLNALNFNQVDRPPLDLGSTPNTTISRIACENLIEYLGLNEPEVVEEMRTISRSLQVVNVPEAVLDRLGVDTRSIFVNPPEEEPEWLSETEYVDDWGVKFRAAKQGDRLLYYDMVQHPLRELDSPDEVESYSWPSPSYPGRVEGLEEKAKKIKAETDYALVGHPGDTSLFERSWYMRGMDRFFMDLLKNRDIAEAIIDRVYRIRKIQMKEYLDAVGPYLDVVSVGDDLGMQSSPLISPDTYREVIKPYHRKYFKFIKNLTGAKLHMHSCGAIRPLLEDLIEVGVDVINPVQVSATGMEPAELREEFGGRLAFWGGIDTQRLLPTGSAEEVKAGVRDTIDAFRGLDGGYVLCAVHDIQADVPPENVVAMFEAGRHYGGRV